MTDRDGQIATNVEVSVCMVADLEIKVCANGYRTRTIRLSGDALLVAAAWELRTFIRLFEAHTGT
jgi:hypothetical protein